MYRFFVFFAVFALVSARAPIPSIDIETSLKTNLIEFSDEEDNLWPLFKLKNSSIPIDETNEKTDVFSFAQLTAVPSKGKVEDTIRYTIGKRVQNDRLVGHGSDAKKWATPQDVTLNLRYPSSGQGATVTYVEIIVAQSSNLGDGKLIAGGIGQRSIAIVVTARNTYWFAYDVSFYGL